MRDPNRRSHLQSSEARLWELIAERARLDARGDRAAVDAIDRRVWDLFGETWAVMFTDLSGFSRQVEAFGILHFLQVIHEHARALEPVLAAHDGILVKTEADSMMVLFRRPASAVRCAVAMQHALDALNVGRAPETQVLLCVGIGYGPLLRIGDEDVYGAQVNAASKLGEDTAKAKEVLVTRAVVDALREAPDADWSFEPLAEPVAGSAENFRLRYR
jgi:class 3 adenylate cyclase